ncbi:MAG: hypothetical protein ABFD07_19705 [Methanobacterium sp.]
MKRIVIYQENIDPIILNDDSDEQVSSYVDKLSIVFNATKITTIQTSDKILIVRPSKVVSISVSELDEKVENSIEEDVIRDE